MTDSLPQVGVNRYGAVAIEEDLIICAFADNGHVYIPLLPVCQVIGVDPAAEEQRIQESHPLRQGLALVPFNVREGERFVRKDLISISLTRLHTWLGSIPVDSITNSAMRHKLARLQDELADLVWGYFGRPLLPAEMKEEQDPYLTPEKRQFYATLEELARISERIEAAELAAQAAGQRAAAAEGALDDLSEKVKKLEIALSETPPEGDFITRAQKEQYKAIVHLVGQKLFERKEGNEATVERTLKEMFNFTSYRVMEQDQWVPVVQYCARWYQRMSRPGTPLPQVFQIALKGKPPKLF